MLLNWSPPSEYEIPVYINSDMMDGLLASVKESMKAISSTGLIVMSIPLALVIVYIIVKSFTGSNAINQGVRKRSISRKIFKADVDRNMVDILDDKMLHKEVDLLANKKFHGLHKNMLVDASVRSMEISHLAKKKYNKKHRAWLVDDKVDGMLINHLAERQFAAENSNVFGEKKDLYKEQNDKYYVTHPKERNKKGRK